MQIWSPDSHFLFGATQSLAVNGQIDCSAVAPVMVESMQQQITRLIPGIEFWKGDAQVTTSSC